MAGESSLETTDRRTAKVKLREYLHSKHTSETKTVKTFINVNLCEVSMGDSCLTYFLKPWRDSKQKSHINKREKLEMLTKNQI